MASRVRAVLAGADVPSESGRPADGPTVERDRVSALPWLPGDDFMVPAPPVDDVVVVDDPVFWTGRGSQAPVVRGSPASVVGGPPPPESFGAPASAVVGSLAYGVLGSSAPVPGGPAPPAMPGAAPGPWAGRSGGRIARIAARWPVRIDPGRRGAIAVGVAVLIAAVVTCAWVFASRPHGFAITGPGADPAASAPGPSTPARSAVSSAAASASQRPTLVVDVAGRVRHPGLYRLPAGSRVDDAVRAAGGVLPGVDLTALNLAAKVADGQQIAVGAPGAVSGGAASPAAGSSGAAPTSAPIDLNTATLEQLESLPGVGPVLGQHILDWRAAHGRFDTIDQLRDVSGIGDAKFAAMRALVSV